jgi:addiction module HigA family antidote
MPGSFDFILALPLAGAQTAASFVAASRITDAAAALDVTRTTLSELVNEKRGISAEMAVRLSQVFGGSAESWLVQQAQYDLADLPSGRIKRKRLEFA